MIAENVEHHFVRVLLVIVHFVAFNVSEDWSSHWTVTILDWIEHFKWGRITASSSSDDIFAHCHRPREKDSFSNFQLQDNRFSLDKPTDYDH